MPELTNIFEDYTVFCKTADEFIKSAKEYFKKGVRKWKRC